MNWHSCLAPSRAMMVPDTVSESEPFNYDLFTTLVATFTYVFPILILPLAIPIATLRTCISRQCCVPRYKQPIGELIMTSILCLIYLGTIVGVMLPRIAEMVKIEELDPAKKAKAPLLGVGQQCYPSSCVFYDQSCRLGRFKKP